MASPPSTRGWHWEAAGHQTGSESGAGGNGTELSELHYGKEEGLAAVAATVPLGRMGLPRDVADVCLFLASPLSSYVSGAGILMHGGGERPAFLAAAKGTKP